MESYKGINMYKVDIHSNKETVKDALYQLDVAIKIARRDKDKLLCIITGYGSHNTSHKIKIAIEEKLEEYVNNKFIKAWIRGNELDIFNKKYQEFPNNHKISNEDKNVRNPGAIYISL